MSIALAATLAASMTLPVCSWDKPGANPFMGDVVAAVDRYADIPDAVRARLKARMETRQYDEIATIRRDTITGKRKYAPEIRDMHFGQGQVCRTVTRAKWRDDMVERGLVYCDSGHCILVPTVCRNVSRIKRQGAERVAAGGGDEPLLVPGGLTAGPAAPGLGSAPGGGGDSSLPNFNSTPSAGGSGGGDGSFQSLAGLPPSVLVALGPTGASVPLGLGGGGGEGGLPTGGGLGGIVPGPGGGGGGGGGMPIVSGGGAGGGGGTGVPGDGDGLGPPPPAPGVGGILGIGPTNNPVGGSGLPAVAPIPEPFSWALWLLGLAGLGLLARPRR